PDDEADPGEGDEGADNAAEASDETFARPESATPLAPAIGQWVRYGTTWRSGGRSTTEYRIVDRQNDTWWIEVTDVRRGRTKHMRMQVRPGEGGREHEVLDLTFNNRGTAERIPARLLATYQPMLQQWLGILFPPSWESDPQEDITVRAGHFEQAFKGEKTLRFMDRSVTADVWYHPSVPITGMVKFVDQGGGHTLELLGFGLTGARSAF
ncbi:MAG TPA: hypothetical protein RMH80_33560, partial [Polyangiaceae bacterium LLY-WYZ-15_(1-7)]|nr:hypothetical protein [Polyangiaceae bacterium LLY-WYZ-15_(1-7)]